MHESVFRLDPRSDGLYSITRASFDTTRPNGLVLSPDETTLYLAESPQAPRRAPRASCLLGRRRWQPRSGEGVARPRSRGFRAAAEREVPTLVFESARVDAAGATDIGKVRQTNEDQYLIAGLRRVVEIEETSIPIEGRLEFTRGASALLLLVADGVGGGKGGEEASSRTLDTIVRYVAGSSLFFSNLDQEGQRALLHDLTLSVQWSHAAVRNEAAASTNLQGMATTLTMVLVLWPRAYVVQIGDSRCYHLRPPTITQVTKDQTMAQEMVDQGVLPAAAAERSPLSHVLSQAVGNRESEIWPEISSLDLEPGDTLLLCTDGLTKHLAEAQIAELMTKADSAKGACASLIDAALRDGGSDNVTVVVTRLLT